MAIGNSQALLAENQISRLFIRAFGIPDLHTHIRIKPLLRFYKRLSLPEKQNILELGCGNGINLLEISKINPHFRGEGFDLNSQEIQRANEIITKMNIKNLSFFHGDATQLSFEKKYDVILLIDFLEHLPNPKSFLEQIDGHLKNDGYLLVSVPTPLYPKVFGRDFHESIGHLVDGFCFDDLKACVPSTYEIVNKKYSTGLLACLGCYFFYRIKFQVKYLTNLLKYFFLLFSYLDLINNKHVSSSLFVAFKKKQS